MKYKVGDVLLVKKCEWKPRPLRRRRPRPHRDADAVGLVLQGRHPRLLNTYGIITAIEKHSDIFEKDSTENDNGYIWYSQVDGREYYFYENEVEGEVIE